MGAEPGGRPAESEEIIQSVRDHGYTEDLRDALYASEDFEQVWKSGNRGRIIHRYTGDDDIRVIEDPRGELYVEGVDDAREDSLSNGTSFRTLKELLMEEGFYDEPTGFASDREPPVQMMFFLEQEDYRRTQVFVESSEAFELLGGDEKLIYGSPGISIDFIQYEPEEEREQNMVQVDLFPDEWPYEDLDSLEDTVWLLFGPEELEHMSIGGKGLDRHISAHPDFFVSLDDVR